VRLEKAFAIKATPETIWQALQADLAEGDLDAFSVERSIPNELIELQVRLQGGVDAALTYTLIPRDGFTEVVATMEPTGFRYLVFRIITFGRANINYELVLVQGLSNLKQAVEVG
jgi:hypothetical protein